VLNRRLLARVCAILLTVAIFRTAGAASPGAASITAADLRTWLTFVASDDLEGRANYTDGLERAGAYITDHLREWKLRPAGDADTYVQTVRVLGVRSTSRSSVSVRVGSEVRTFRDGAGVTFPKNAGGKRTLTLDRVEFAGYALDAPALHRGDLNGRNVAGAAVVWLGSNGPRDVNPQTYRRVLNERGRHLTDDLRAGASIASDVALANVPPGYDGTTTPFGTDFATSQRLDRTVTPAIGASAEVLDFMFSRAPVPYAQLAKRAEARESLPSFTLDGVSLTFTIDADYEVVRTDVTYNIVGVVTGSDPGLSGTYVAFGAHYDHVGSAEAPAPGDAVLHNPPGRITPSAPRDRIWNGADDDGSGVVAMMALARAFATAPRPRRSLLFVWHAGEELGTFGSRYFADYPTVPLDRVVAQLNIDMVGRNRDDERREQNTVYLVGSDRISSELHEISRSANRGLDPPLRLDYAMNDPSDPEQIYYRSDHYSYAAKGIPVIFFTTGLHPDYHANTDEVSKIDFHKLTRIATLVYETGRQLADLDHAPRRDNQGPRAGKGTP